MKTITSILEQATTTNQLSMGNLEGVSEETTLIEGRVERPIHVFLFIIFILLIKLFWVFSVFAQTPAYVQNESPSFFEQTIATAPMEIETVTKAKLINTQDPTYLALDELVANLESEEVILLIEEYLIDDMEIGDLMDLMTSPTR